METSLPKQPLYTAEEKKGLVTGTLVSLGLILLFAVILFAYKMNVPEHVDRDTSSITTLDYEVALAKWRQRDVAEYTITTSLQDIQTLETHQFTLRVLPKEDSIELLEYRVNGASDTAPSDYCCTVDDMFEVVRERLDQMSSGTRLVGSSETTDQYRDFVVRFDPNLGSPTLIEDFVRGTDKGREITWRDKAQASIEVKNITVLR